jgi:hypothetical protein
METSGIIGSYRISRSERDILQLMLKSQEGGHSILWQTHEDHRVILNIKNFDLNLQKKMVVVGHAPTNDFLDITRPVYIKLGFRESVFKGKIVKIKPDLVEVSIPDEIHWREFREQERLVFKLNQHFILAKPHIPHLMPELIPTLKLSLRDITVNGMGLLSTGENDQFFTENKIIDVVSLDESALPQFHSGLVVWKKRVQTKAELSEGYVWRLGVKMIQPFSHQSLDALSGGGHKRQKIAKNLIETNVWGEEFHKTLDKAVNLTIDKMKKRPALARYLRQLEISRNNNEYLSEHIEVLIVVCTFLARAMNWVSEASLEKFVYAAYVHDAPLYENPKLAMIQDKYELERVQSQLTKSEVELFYRSPAEAARIAHEDKMAPAGY